jgi:histone deacetylase complex regulatory component SIN3
MAEEFDFSKGIEQLQEMLSTKEGEEQIQSILGSLMGSASDTSADESKASANTASSDSPQQGGLGDILSGLGNMDTLMKIQKVMNAVSNTKDSTASNFLQALKPYLSNERRQKVDQAAKLITVTKALKAFKELGGD